jgi:hypothetical protein
VGFFDSFKVGIGAIGGFIEDIAPTAINLLDRFGVLPPASQPVLTRGPARDQFGRPVARQFNQPVRQVLPGGAVTDFQARPVASPFLANQPGVAPVGFPTGQPTPFTTSPTGVVTLPSFSAQRPGLMPAGLDLPFIDIVPQGQAALGGLSAPFGAAMPSARPQTFVVPNPVTGRPTWFKPAGRPILWSGDLTACKRVSRIARRARRSKR